MPHNPKGCEHGQIPGLACPQCAGQTVTQIPVSEALALACAYGSLLIRVHDLRKAAVLAERAAREACEYIARGRGEWPHVARILAASAETLAKEIALTEPQAGPRPDPGFKPGPGSPFSGAQTGWGELGLAPILPPLDTHGPQSSAKP